MAEMKYPWQVDAVKRKNKIIGADAQLFLPTEKESISPLEIHSGFSRFVFSIIDKQLTGAIQVPRANIPARDIPYIYLKTKIAMEKYMDKPLTPVENEVEFGASVAYTQKLSDKKFKDRTPAEVLIENPENKEELLRIRKWLSDNLTRYKGNKYQIEAIDEAINLMKIGELSEPTDAPKANLSTMTLYKSENKYMSQKNDKGFRLVYQITIIFDAGRNYPYTINIMNCYAPVVDGEGGQKNIMMSSATDITKTSFSMSEMEWVGFITRIKNTLDNFETMNFPGQYGIAQSNSYQH